MKAKVNHKTVYLNISCYLCHLKFDTMNAILIPLGVFGPWQIILIVVLALLLFGGKKIPELMRGLGSGLKEFKDASKDDTTENNVEDKK